MQDDAGADVDPADVVDLSLVISGPTYNSNLILNGSIPTEALTGVPPYTVNVPETLLLERLGVATAGQDTFLTSRSPLWDSIGASTVVHARTGTVGGDDFLAAEVDAPVNFVDVVDETGFDRNDYVVLDDGMASEEYLRVQWVDGSRLWFSSPAAGGYVVGPRLDHPAGATVREVTLAELVLGADYTLDEATGTVDEISFGNGETILASYTSDFVMPSTYSLALNGSPDLGEAHGEWAGKSIVDGTYSLALWSRRDLTLSLHGEDNAYRATSEAVALDFLVGSATAVEPYAAIDSGNACLSCHGQLIFHGAGRRGWNACIGCHGTAGAEDRPRYVAPGAPDTTGVTINMRTMLHKIHMGEELANASTYSVVGFGSGYPDNYSVHQYGEVVFPALPQGVKDCAKCHGESNEHWSLPPDREHPSEQTRPVLEWTVTCGACHDSDEDLGHMELMTTSGGQETCTVCHSEEDVLSVETVHEPR